MEKNEPRRWSLPAAPGDVARVRGKRSDRIHTARTNDSGKTFWRSEEEVWSRSWSELLAEECEVEEIPETELEAAVRRLREARNRAEFQVWQSQYAADIRTVLYHVLDGGTL
jgi:hypothetical protein